MADKMTVDTFKENLDGGRYETIAGARRAIGRVNGWTDKERAKARVMADNYFGLSGDGGEDEEKKPAKKAPGKGKKTAKRAAAKAVSEDAVSPKASAAIELKAAPVRTPVVAGERQEWVDAEGVRLGAASNIISTFGTRGLAGLSPEEELIYRTAMGEYRENAKANPLYAAVTTQPPQPAHPQIAPPLGAPPQIPLPGNSVVLTPDQQQALANSALASNIGNIPVVNLPSMKG